MKCSSYLATTPALNFNHLLVQQFVEEHSSGSKNITENAISLYYAVRDTIRYNPYELHLTVNGMKASTTLQLGSSWCVPKAVLLAACCRNLGIPARLGFGDVRNHMSTRRMREWMQTDVFYWHGFAELFLHERWIKATPAFNLELCEKFGLAPLEFDGENDSIFHPFDRDGNKHMEYLHERGSYDDLPLKEILATFTSEYSGMLVTEDADFDQDIEDETNK